MKIEYLGHSSFAITSAGAKIVTDPFDSNMVGLPFPKVLADIVTVSHEHEDHNAIKAVGGKPVVFRLPGEYERKGVRVYGYDSFHDDAKGRERGKNTMFKFVIDGIVVLHCGDLGHLPDDTLLEHIKDTDIMMVPVGGHFTIGPKEAKELVSLVAPGIVLPMHYRDEGMTETFAPLALVDEFIKLSAPTMSRKLDNLTVSLGTLPEEREIVTLKRI